MTTTAKNTAKNTAITTVIFDYGGVISSPLFVGLARFEQEEGYPRGSLLRLMFGDEVYLDTEGRAVAEAKAVEAGRAEERAEELVEELADAVGADPDAVETEGEAADAPAWHRLERGEISFGDYFDDICRNAPVILGRPLDLESYGRFWSGSAPGVHWMVVQHVQRLREEGWRLGLLTNNVKEFGDHWRASFPVDELFEVVVDSSHVGMRKPEPRIYELTCERLGIAPPEAVFVDDNHDNVAAAAALGMRTVLFGSDPWAALADLDALLGR